MISKILNLFRSGVKKDQVDTISDSPVKVQNYQVNRKSLPLGESDYETVVSEYYYVDKTLLIKDLIDCNALVTLFTRPRRFGKTLNMSMLKSFFELSEKDTSYLFADKKIWEAGTIYRQYQGKYPVIFISFKDIKDDNWGSAFPHICSVIAREYTRHSVLKDSAKLADVEKDLYNSIAHRVSGEWNYSSSLLSLSIMLEKHYGIEPIIIIDESDTPILQGCASGYYDQVVNFMSMLYSSALKDNSHIKFGFMTGILNFAHGSIFSGLNNIIVDTVLNNRYSQYFGFTEDEVREMASCYLSSSKIDEIKEWYDGYRFGKSDIYNPWSVLNYFSEGCNPQPYWVNTSSNEIIGDIVSRIDEADSRLLFDLLQGGTVSSQVNLGFIYPDFKNSRMRPNLDMLFTFLLMTGYLKAIRTTNLPNGKISCDLCIPNKEISAVYEDEIISRKIETIQGRISTTIQDAIRGGDKDLLRDKLEELLLGSASYYDTAKESFYHGLLLGLCAMMNSYYEITSNRESGEGRYDICLRPKKSIYPGIIIELKATDNVESLDDVAEGALQQIESKKYDTLFGATDISLIFKYGMAFCGKKAEVKFSQAEIKPAIKLSVEEPMRGLKIKR